MPGRSQYPTGDDLRSFLLQGAFSEDLVDGFDLELFAEAGWQAFNRLAGRQMLAVAGSRSYDRPWGVGGVIDLGEDLASAGSATLADNATTLTLNTDYRLEPLEAAGRGTPYNRVRFWRRLWSYSATIAPPLTLTGSWGYATSIPEDAWVGMLQMAALEMLPVLAQNLSGGLESWTEADMTERYGSDPLKGLAGGWMLGVQRTAGGVGPDGKYRVGRYTRVTVG